MPVFDQTKQTQFLAHLMNGKSIKSACEAVGISRGTYYAHRKEFPNFESAVKDAMEGSVDELIDVARARALDKSDPKSATMLIFLIKGMRPEYKESWRHEPTVIGKESKSVDFTNTEIEEAMKILDQAKVSGGGVESEDS